LRLRGGLKTKGRERERELRTTQKGVKVTGKEAVTPSRYRDKPIIKKEKKLEGGGKKREINVDIQTRTLFFGSSI